MSSEMEGVVLKATRPDDLPVKPKHLEALMRPTVEMPKEFNVYLPVVRACFSFCGSRALLEGIMLPLHDERFATPQGKIGHR